MMNLPTLFEAYPYLGGSLILLMVCLVALVLFPAQRGPMLLSGLLSAPYALASVVFVPEYWNPVRVADFLTGPEDIIFSFANGSIVWLLVSLLLPGRIALRVEPARLLGRYLAFALLGLALGALFGLAGLGTMTATLIAIAVVGALLLCLRGQLWPIVVAGALGFTTLYVVVAISIFAMWPHFLSQWTTANLWGFTVFGMPAEEVAWAFAFGAVWPLGMAYAFDARIMNTRTSGEPITKWIIAKATEVRNS